jgi:site-specific DNA-methyltransferase (adenine-specific)
MREEGYDIPLLPVDYIDADSEEDAKRKLLHITSQYGEFTVDGFENFTFGLDGFEDIRLTNDEFVFKTKEEEGVVEDDYEIPEEIETDIQVGDVFEIGEHRLMCGDSTDQEMVVTLMNNNLADMVVTDPPYNVDYTGGTKDALKIMNDKKSDTEFYDFLYQAFSNLAKSIKRGGSAYVFHADTEGLNFRKAFMESGFLMKQCLIWEKNSLVMGRQDYQWMHEPILYGWLEGASHSWYSDRKQTTLLKFDRPIRSKEHPTMKPVSIVGYLIKNSSKEDDIILDTFLGSGTTMVASHQLGRKCYGMELDPKYCKVIIDRMKLLDSTIVIKKNGEVYE